MTIKEMRNKLGMTQEMFSKRYNIPKRTIENWESGKRTPPGYVIEMLENAIKHYIPKTEKELMTSPVTVYDLKLMCDNMIAQGYGGRSIMISNDAECTGYHPMLWGLDIEEENDEFATIN